MKLTHELLTKLIEENDIECAQMRIDDASVIQLKCAYSIDTQSPADDDDKVIAWLLENRERFSFYYTELVVESKTGVQSIYDWRETDDCLKIAKHYNVVLTPCVGWTAIHAGLIFSHQEITIAIMGCIAQLSVEQHAYAS